MKGWLEFLFYVSVSCGMALATSVFTMMSGLFGVASSLWVFLGVLLAGGFCMIIAFSIGELASMYPSAPGIRTYLKAAFGDEASLLMVHLYLISVVLIAGLESFIVADVVRAVYPNVQPLYTILFLLVTVVAINLAGLELPKWMQIATAILAVLITSSAGAAGIVNAKINLFATFSSEIGLKQAYVLPAAAGMAVFLYMGFEWVTPIGLRPASYKRAIPISMIVSVGVLATVYCLFALGAACQLPRNEISSTSIPQVSYFVSLIGHGGAYWALGLSFLAISSTFNAGIMGGSRLIFLLATEGKLPQWCGGLSLRTGAPTAAILLLGTLGLISAIGVMTFRAEILAAVIGASIICLIYSAFMAAVIVLRRGKPEIARPYRTPVWGPVQAITALTLPFMAIQTLFSEPKAGFKPAIGVALAVAMAAVLTWRYRGHKEAANLERDAAKSAISGQLK